MARIGRPRAKTAVDAGASLMVTLAQAPAGSPGPGDAEGRRSERLTRVGRGRAPSLLPSATVGRSACSARPAPDATVPSPSSVSGNPTGSHRRRRLRRWRRLRRPQRVRQSPFLRTVGTVRCAQHGRGTLRTAFSPHGQCCQVPSFGFFGHKRFCRSLILLSALSRIARTVIRPRGRRHLRPARHVQWLQLAEDDDAPATDLVL